MEIVATEGGREVVRQVEFYNLDAIIAVGYRVNSYQATQFRIWATRTLREFMIKGFVLDDERLKQGHTAFGKAKLKAEGEYEVYRKHQDAEYVSDFDRVVEEAKRLEAGKAPRPTGAVTPTPTRAASGKKKR